jgi:hypothetical protein
MLFTTIISLASPFERVLLLSIPYLQMTSFSVGKNVTPENSITIKYC